jgi:hypothetical protein
MVRCLPRSTNKQCQHADKIELTLVVCHAFLLRDELTVAARAWLLPLGGNTDRETSRTHAP